MRGGPGGRRMPVVVVDLFVPGGGVSPCDRAAGRAA